jgi:transposase InsO family protein
MGLETLYANPYTSQPQPCHRVYPYLLRGVPITRVNQVWSMDITYIRTTERLCVCSCRARLVQSIGLVLDGVHYHGCALMS